MTVQEQVAELVHKNGLIPVLSALVKVCDHDAVAIPNNLGATMIAYRIQQVLEMCQRLAKREPPC